MRSNSFSKKHYQLVIFYTLQLLLTSTNSIKLMELERLLKASH